MRIHHIALRTRDVARLARFYVEVLGLMPREGVARDRVWLDCAGTLLMLEPASETEPEIDPRSLELVAFAILPGDRARLEARLAAGGVSVEARTAFTLYFRDPDGRRVALSHYPDT
jgi:catechol 2,3-dioxygenase-like lactoylglutathione lyase family enzyme